MYRLSLAGAAAALALAAGTPAGAAVYTPAAGLHQGTGAVKAEPVQFRPRYGGGYYGRPYAARPLYGPRPYYGARPYYAARPGAWVYRPWYRRPYYGAVIGGVVIGTIVAATAYGVAPARPRPDLCWYWADPDRARGYWDYCN